MRHPYPTSSALENCIHEHTRPGFLFEIPDLPQLLVPGGHVGEWVGKIKTSGNRPHKSAVSTCSTTVWSYSSRLTWTGAQTSVKELVGGDGGGELTRKLADGLP